jgi:biotin carboxylase
MAPLCRPSEIRFREEGPHAVVRMKILMLASDDALPYHVLRCAATAGLEVQVLGFPGAGRARHLAWSRHCLAYFPPPQDHGDEALLASVASIVRARQIDAVIPSDAGTTRFLARHGPSIPARVFPVPDVAAFDALLDKIRFADVCSEVGLPHPSTRLFPTLDALIEALSRGALDLPLIVKPTRSSGGAGVQPLHGSDPVRRLGSVDYAPVLVQELVPGEDVSISVLCHRGAIRASATYRYRADEGLYQTFHDERVHQLARRIIEHVGYSGVAGFDVRLGPGGQAWLIECNPRFTYNVDVTMLAGINFVSLGLEPDQGRRAPELRAPDQRIFHARLLKPWTLIGPEKLHARHLLDDDLRLPLLISLRDAAGYRARWALDALRSVGPGVSGEIAQRRRTL